jgi:hypothetical protein
LGDESNHFGFQAPAGSPFQKLTKGFKNIDIITGNGWKQYLGRGLGVVEPWFFSQTLYKKREHRLTACAINRQDACSPG